MRELARGGAPAIFALAIAAAGCATQADVQLVRQEVRDVRTVAADAQALVASLKRDVEGLRGDVEALKFQGGSGPRTEELRQSLDSLDARIGAVEQVLRGAPPPAEAGGGEAPAPGAPAGQVARPIDAEAVPAGAPPEYRDGVGLLRSGNGDAAIQKFREFLRKSPRSELADDAQYWIGEAYFGARDFNRAILEYNEVQLRYPKGNRVAAALWSQGLAFAELGDKVDARLVLQKLVAEHGDAPEAERARQKLAELSQ
jgi:tol-pal system protein YbgF